MEAEKKTQEADERKQTWKCCTDFFLIEVDMHVNIPPKHVSESRAVWSRSRQEDVAFDGFCGNWNENFEAKVKLPLAARYNLCKWECPRVRLWNIPWLPAVILINSHIIQKAQQVWSTRSRFSKSLRKDALDVHAQLPACRPERRSSGKSWSQARVVRAQSTTLSCSHPGSNFSPLGTGLILTLAPMYARYGHILLHRM